MSKPVLKQLFFRWCDGCTKYNVTEKAEEVCRICAVITMADAKIKVPRPAQYIGHAGKPEPHWRKKASEIGTPRGESMSFETSICMRPEQRLHYSACKGKGYCCPLYDGCTSSERTSKEGE